MLVWVAIIATKLARLERETGELAELARRPATGAMAELLVWPALIAYGEAAFAYAGELRGPGRYGRLGIWGVRIGWLAQTALLVVQACRQRRLPVGHVGRRAEPLRLARRRRVPDLGLHASLPAARAAVMPLAAALLVLAWAGGGTGVHTADGGRMGCSTSTSA